MIRQVILIYISDLRTCCRNQCKISYLLIKLSLNNKVPSVPQGGDTQLSITNKLLLCKFYRKYSDNTNRGSYMSAHVLLNLLNELGKRDKMRGLPSILSVFRNEFNKFNNTRA